MEVFSRKRCVEAERMASLCIEKTRPPPHQIYDRFDRVLVEYGAMPLLVPRGMICRVG